MMQISQLEWANTKDFDPVQVRRDANRALRASLGILGHTAISIEAGHPGCHTAGSARPKVDASDPWALRP